MKFDFDTPVDRSRNLEHALGALRRARRDPAMGGRHRFPRRRPRCSKRSRARIAHGVFGYSTPPPELREAIVERMQRLYRWRIDPSWIVFLPGVVPGLHLAARKLVPPGGHVLVPRPVYHHFKRAAGARAARVQRGAAGS